MQGEKCGNNCSQLGKSTYRTEQEKKKLTRRLNVIEGQIRGIKQMIANNRYCDDVLIQIAAVYKSLQTLGNTILESHLKTCVSHEIQMGNVEILEDVLQLIKKLQ